MAHEMPQVAGVTHHWVSARGLKFHVAEAGEGDPVLLLHGFPQHWWEWRLVMPQLAEGRRVLAMDLRGFGWTDIAWEGFEKENMADDVIAVLESLGVERVTIVGHDWGGWIGYLLALRRPDLIDRLVVLSCPPPWGRTSWRNVGTMWRFRYQLPIASPIGPKLFRLQKFVPRKLDRWSAVDRHLKGSVKRIYARDLRASTRARAASLLYRTFLTTEIRQVMKGRYRKTRLTVPTLILAGGQDPIMHRGVYAGYDANADDIRLETIAKAGHLLPEEVPGRVVQRIREFLGDAAPQPAPDEATAPQPAADASA